MSWKSFARTFLFALLITVLLPWVWSHSTPGVSYELEEVSEGLHPDHPWLEAGRVHRRVTRSVVLTLSRVEHGSATRSVLDSAIHVIDEFSAGLDSIESNVPAANYVRISDRFGMRFHPILKRWRMHNGVDYAAPRGTRIIAVDEGVVTFVGWAGAAGRLVKVEHDGYESVYAHLSRFARGIEPGATVVQGQYLGAVGASGRATGHHLHFGTKVDGRWVDPFTIADGRIEPIKEAQFLADFEKGMASTITEIHSRTFDAFRAAAANSEDSPELDELWFDDTFL